MTARLALSQSALDRAAAVAKAQGVTVTITAKDGTVYQIAPVDAANTTDADFIKWGAK